MLDFRPTFLWIDMEMSGLDPKTNKILEFACVLSDGKAIKTIDGPELIIHCDEKHLSQMD